MKRTAIIGHFAEGKEYLDGQTVKTKIVAAELERHFGDEEVLRVDTHGGKKNLLTLPFRLLSVLKRCRNVVILPAQNGLRVIAPLLALQNKLFRRKLHYAVIGGWLAPFLQDRPALERTLKTFDAIYVETKTMKKALEDRGFSNIVLMPNCKDLRILPKEMLVYPTSEPYALCTFSRVMKEKGIEDAVTAVKAVNELCKRTVYTLDIYGQVDPSQEAWFEKLQSEFPSYVRYGGLVPFDKSVEVVKEYFALLFPTRFFTEGIPGTIIDAYAAGVPVIASKWESFDDVVDDGITGIGYAFAEDNALKDLLINIAKDPQRVNSLKPNCVKKAECFVPISALKVLETSIDE